MARSDQCRKIYDEALVALKESLPNAEICHARYVYHNSLSNAIEKLLKAGCNTIIYQCFCNPVYSDFEKYAFVFPLIHKMVKGRAKVIFADQLGNQASMRMAYVQLVYDQLKQIPGSASILLILSKHGHPFSKETQDRRGVIYRRPLEGQMRSLLKEWGGTWDLIWSDDEYADEYWDSRNRKMCTFDA